MKIITFFFILIALAGVSPAQKAGQKAPAKKPEVVIGSQLVMTIEHNGSKTEVKYSQFKTADGNATLDPSGKLVLFYGASNDKDDKSFSFQGWTSTEGKGTFPIGGTNARTTGLSIMTTEFPDVMFIAKSGSFEITAAPLAGGFVEGTFSVACEVLTSEGNVETYNIIGSFKLKRM